MDQPTPAKQPMTSEEFDSKYRLLKQIAGGHWRTFTAEQRSSGRAVLAHFVDQVGSGGSASLFALIEQLKPRDRSKVLETMTVGGSLVFVTEVLEGFEGFESWLRSRSTPSPEPVPPVALPPPAGQGEFTQLFRGHSEELPPSPRPSPAPNQASSGSDSPRGRKPAKPQSPEPAGAGFTDLFRAPPAPLPTPQPAPRLDAVSPPPPLDSVLPPPRLDSVLPPPRQDGVAPPPLRVVGLRFGSQAEGPPRPPKPNFGGTFDQAEGAPRPPKPNFGGTFDPAATPVPVEPRLPQELFPAVPGPAPMPAAPPPIWSGPSEFTRQLERRPAISAVVPTAVPAPEPDPPPEKKSYVPLLLALNLIVIIATGLIVYFALRRR
jgi:hypothetical protein